MRPPARVRAPLPAHRPCLTINRDVYYGIYSFAVFGFFALWLRYAVDQPRALLTRNWRWGVLLGVAFAGVTAAIPFTEKATPHPHGLRLRRRDHLARRRLRRRRRRPALGLPDPRRRRRLLSRPLRERSKRALAGIGAAALAASLLFTAVYHLGYSDFRGEKVRKPLIGDVVWSTPTLATLSPIGAPLAHIGLHVSAVVHAYDTDTFLPPHPKTTH